MAERRGQARPGPCQVGQPAGEADCDRAGLALAAPSTGQRTDALVPRACGLNQGPDAPDPAGCDGLQADRLLVALCDGRPCAGRRCAEGLTRFAAAAAGCSRRSGTSVDRCPPGPKVPLQRWVPLSRPRIGPRTWDGGQVPCEGRPDTRWSGRAPSREPRGRSRFRPADCVRTEEITLDTVNLIQVEYRCMSLENSCHGWTLRSAS